MKEWKGKTIVDEEKRRVFAVSKYKGKTVRGIAKCKPGDIFDSEVGKKLAIARCLKKIAEKRYSNFEKSFQFRKLNLKKQRRNFLKQNQYCLNVRKI